MSVAPTILDAIRRAGVEVRLVGGKLQIRGKLPPGLARELREHRAEVLAALADAEPTPVFAPEIEWCSPEPQHRRVVEALAEQDAERLALWKARKAGTQ
ncbi:MAG: hypothetical protein JXB13_01895 [Phycisphaerae bacterium]|nr:hypothetical protein [Phycisphaerae bacterium]